MNFIEFVPSEFALVVESIVGTFSWCGAMFVPARFFALAALEDPGVAR